MRIISGKLKGRHIPVRKNFPARPTTDFAKENLFNILNNRLVFEDLKVLDLFAGTGSISFEFASRGSKMVHAVEKNFQSSKYIKQTAEKLGLGQIKCFSHDAFRFLNRATEKYNLVFADPPYQMEGIENIPEIILESDLLEDGAWLILEHPAQYQFSAHPNFVEMRKYSSVHFSIFINS